MRLNYRINGKNIDAISIRQGKDSSRLLLGVNTTRYVTEVVSSVRVLEKVETEY